MKKHAIGIFCLCAIIILAPTAAYAATNVSGQDIDLSNSSNYKMRFVGANASDWLTEYRADVFDVDGNGKNDLIIPTTYADYNGRNHSSSVYIVYNSITDNYSENGKNIDLVNSSN